MYSPDVSHVPPALIERAPDGYVRGPLGLYVPRKAGWWPWIPVQPPVIPTATLLVPGVCVPTDTAVGVTSSGALDFTGLSIGTAAANRYIIVAFTKRSDASGTVTVGGAACTMVVEGTETTESPDGKASVWITNAPVTSGTTATVSITGLSGSQRVGVSVFAATGINPTASDTSTQQSSSAASISDSGVTIPAHGIYVAAVGCGSSGTSIAWTNATVNGDAANTNYRHSAAYRSDDAGSTPTVTADGATAEYAFAAASFAPG